ncbi:MAG TPA: endonuclease/exonuclease/phosphatase family protein [bacterium]|nr:endonuclease/exonuclease/phosphatase family protein [bacterium]
MEELLQLCALLRERHSRSASALPVHRRLKADQELRESAGRLNAALTACHEIHAPSASPALPADRSFRAVTWNLERGKNFPAILKTLREHSELRDADFFLLTEVDWGMARSGNRNVAAELAEGLGYFGYFVPSYYNFTLGHGLERDTSGENRHGLHGKALLSRYRLSGLRSVALPNPFDKLKSREARLGQKRALVAELNLGEGESLTLACTHLDAFSSPKIRARQLGTAVSALRHSSRLLLAGDWNTNTINSLRGRAILGNVLRKILFTGAQSMIRTHFPRPELKFDKPLFDTLRGSNLDFAACNEIGAGTYDLVSDDLDLGQMARDQFPDWIVRWINRQIQKGGGAVSLKLDWFATRGIRPLQSKVIRLKSGVDYAAGDRPSDHHPVRLMFQVPSV